MLNHFRTLLANLPPTQAVGETIAEEPIPPSFAPAVPSSSAQAVRRVLFGTDPDRAMVNYRTRQFMTVLHGGPYVDHVYALDPRQLYSTGGDSSLVSPLSFLPAVTPLNGTLGRLQVTGEPAAPDAAGRMQFGFEVEVLTSSTVEVKRVRPFPRSDVYGFELSADNLSGPVDLTGSGYAVRLGTDQAGSRWTVDVLNRPQYDLGTLVANLDAVGEEVLADLFGLGGEEPYLTFGNLWRRSAELPDRLAGILLALVYRADAALAGGQTDA